MIIPDNNFQDVVDFCKSDHDIILLRGSLMRDTFKGLGSGYRMSLYGDYCKRFFLSDKGLLVNDIQDVVYFITEYLYTRSDFNKDDLTNEKVAEIVKLFYLTLYFVAGFRKEVAPSLKDPNSVYYAYNREKGHDLVIDPVGCFPGQIRFFQFLITPKYELEIKIEIHDLFTNSTIEDTAIRVIILSKDPKGKYRSAEHSFANITSVKFSDIKDLLIKAEAIS